MSSVSGGELKWRVLSARRWCAQHSLTALLQRCPERGRGVRKARGSTGLPSSSISAVKMSSATSEFIRKAERAAEQDSPFSAWEAFTVPFIEIRKQNLKWGGSVRNGTVVQAPVPEQVLAAGAGCGRRCAWHRACRPLLLPALFLSTMAAGAVRM